MANAREDATHLRSWRHEPVGWTARQHQPDGARIHSRDSPQTPWSAQYRVHDELVGSGGVLKSPSFPGHRFQKGKCPCSIRFWTSLLLQASNASRIQALLSYLQVRAKYTLMLLKQTKHKVTRSQPSLRVNVRSLTAC